MIKELLVATLLILSGGTADYYPANLEKTEVEVNYYNDSTVITLNKALIPAKISCTGSMHPIMGCGNEALLEKLDEEDTITKGDIIAYKNNGNAYILHQIVRKEGSCYVLKGLNNPWEDEECISRDKLKLRAVLILPTN